MSTLHKVMEACGAQGRLLDANSLFHIRNTSHAAMNYAHQLSSAERRAEELAELEHLSVMVKKIRELFPDIPDIDVHRQVDNIRKLAVQALDD